jgi:aryl-alcohol dehydrogenase-like predicted oxidoreductase
MNTLIQQGKILYWGTSEWSGVEIMEAHRVAASYRLIGPSVEQPEYNLFSRQKMENEYLGIFKTVGLGTTIWSPLASGLLTGKYNQGIPEGSRLSIPGFEWLKDKTLMEEKLAKVKGFQTLAIELGTGMAPLAIAWCLRNPHVTTAILGATRKEQLEENFKALEVLPLLSQELMDRIDDLFGTKPRLPDY